MSAGGQANNAFVNAFAFFLNVTSSVFIIFVNKQLMRSLDVGGAGFKYATTLCALHYLVCAVYMWVLQAMGTVKRVDVPLKDLVMFTVAANISIASLNISLLVNSVGFYQIAKLLVIPFVCLVEWAAFSRKFPPVIVAAVTTVVIGVGVVTVTADVSVRSVGGTIIAGLSVVGSGMQQILCRTVQTRNNISSQELLARMAPLQGITLLLIGPPLDWYVTGDWVTDYVWTSNGMIWMFLSCSIAILVNISQFMVLGRFTAVTYQVLGHSKTILVLLGGWLVFREFITAKQMLGMALAVAGMIWYGSETSKKKPVKETAKGAPLLESKGSTLAAGARV
jgi:solute carrier family 35, member E3